MDYLESDMDEIINVYEEFEESYNKCVSIVSFSNQLRSATEGDACIYNLDMHYCMLEKMFINIFTQWEKFLENSFLLYMIGKKDMQGNEYIRYANPIDKQHAYDMLKGVRKYPDWTNISEVVTLAKLYFENLGTYNLLSNMPVEFNEMKTVRNKISHMSEQADSKFKLLVSQKLSNSEIESVGEFLDTNKTSRSTYFEYYTEQILEYVRVISNRSLETR